MRLPGRFCAVKGRGFDRGDILTEANIVGGAALKRVLARLRKRFRRDAARQGKSQKRSSDRRVAPARRANARLAAGFLSNPGRPNVTQHRFRLPQARAPAGGPTPTLRPGR